MPSFTMYVAIAFIPLKAFSLLQLVAEAEPERMAFYLLLVLVGSVKFLLSVLMGLAGNLNLWEVLLTATLGAFIGVGAFAYFGTQIRKWISHNFKRSKNTFSFSRRRKILMVWRRFGLAGIAFLAPVISPPISVGVAVSFREKPYRILIFMGISLVFWTLVFTAFRATAVNLLYQ